MKIFMTGASGYFGCSVALRLIGTGHAGRGLVRTAQKAEIVRHFGIEPVMGELGQRDRLVDEARRADAVVNAADSDHRGAAEALVSALAGTGKSLLHTSGTSIVGDDARGERSDAVFDEETPINPVPDKAARVAI